MSGPVKTEEEQLRAHERLVWSVVRRYGALGEREELFQQGCIGLLQALRRYDPALGTQFSTYAIPCIAGEIRRFLREGGGVRQSRAHARLARRARALRNTFFPSCGREPRLSELAASLSVTPEELACAELGAETPRSLQEPLEGGGCVEDTLCGDAEMEEKTVERESLAEALRLLSGRDACNLRLRYGSGLTQTQTANLLGMTQVQVSRAEKKILSELRLRLGGV